MEFVRKKTTLTNDTINEKQKYKMKIFKNVNFKTHALKHNSIILKDGLEFCNTNMSFKRAIQRFTRSLHDGNGTLIVLT